MAHPCYTTEEIAARGEELYQTQIRRQVEEGNQGKILVLDIDTGEYEIDTDHLRATRRALAKHPDAILYSVRIGYPTLGKIGGGWGRVRSRSTSTKAPSSGMGRSVRWSSTAWKAIPSSACPSSGTSSSPPTSPTPAPSPSRPSRDRSVERLL